MALAFGFRSVRGGPCRCEQAAAAKAAETIPEKIAGIAACGFLAYSVVTLYAYGFLVVAPHNIGRAWIADGDAELYNREMSPLELHGRYLLSAAKWPLIFVSGDKEYL
jgi:hypothetical protein